MKNQMRYISILFIFFISPSIAQTNLDTLKIDAVMRTSFASYNTTEVIDPRIIQTIQAIDKNINAIVQRETSWTPKKFTVIGANMISVRQLVDKQEAIEIILADQSQKGDYKSYWDALNRDTIKFLSKQLTQSTFNLYYPNYQFPKALTSVNPLTFQSQLHCQNILFYTKQLEFTIHSLSKTIVPKLRPTYYEYLTANIDHYWSDKQKVESKAIRIRTITFGTNNMVYSGVDKYATHYLLAFDNNNTWHLESIRGLRT